MSVTGISGTNFAGLAAVKERLRVLQASNVKVGWPKGPMRPDGQTVAVAASLDEVELRRFDDGASVRHVIAMGTTGFEVAVVLGGLYCNRGVEPDRTDARERQFLTVELGNLDQPAYSSRSVAS